MFVLGTAGHIDHGKSALVQALTGMDPDRLSEEKARGMTIDLGFAWLTLPDGQVVGVVDVPGHERFIKNMLAGVGSIDLALLIVAANEGVMPQTTEHLAILDLLGIERGIVVLTKKDLVDQEWLDLVKMDIEELVKGTTFASAPVVAVSSVTKDGLDELAKTISRLLAATEPKKDLGRPRLPVDRIFTIAGSGTVVTGTLIDGSLSVGQEVEIVPASLKARIRGLQTHKTKLNAATPGSRVAANLVGVATTDLVRGYVVTKPGWLQPTTQVSVELRLLGYLKRPLPHNAEVSFHTGAAEAMGKVRLLDKDRVGPGETAWAQIVLDQPVALVKGDHFIIRSPMETLGGGKIVDSHAKRLRRFKEATLATLQTKQKGSTEDVILTVLESKQPLTGAGVISSTELPPSEATPALEALATSGQVVSVGQGDGRLFFTAAGWARLTKEVIGILEDYHKKYPVRLGMPKVELASRLKLGKPAQLVLDRKVTEGTLTEEGLVIRLPSHQIKLTPAQQAKVDGYLRALSQSPYAPPTDQMLEPDLLNLLIERRQVVKVSDGVVFAAKAYDEMVAGVLARIKQNGKITLGETRDMFATTRKYIQPLLEYTDQQKITRRVGDDRVAY